MRVQALAEEQHLRLVGPEPNALNGGCTLWYATAPASVVPPRMARISKPPSASAGHHEVVAELPPGRLGPQRDANLAQRSLARSTGSAARTCASAASLRGPS